MIVEVTRLIACDTCKTTGVKNDDSNDICRACNGRGMKVQQSGNVIIQQTCNVCGGIGKKIEACDKCNGNGYTEFHEKLNLKIPKGIPPMATLKLKDRGNITYQGDYKITGSLFVIIDYPESEEGVTLRNGELFITVKIPFNVVLLDEKVKINVFNCKRLALDLDSSKPSGYQYEIKNGGLIEGKSAFVKVFADFPQKDISDEDKKKLIGVIKEVYGESTTNFKPAAL
jgi:molecular chaperone DnaJ